MTDGWTRMAHVGWFNHPLECFVVAAHAYCTLGGIAGAPCEKFGEQEVPNPL